MSTDHDFDPILVIGGTGMLGEPVVRSLLAAGRAVRVMTRSPEKVRALFGASVQTAPGDVEDASALHAALDGCRDVHINLRAAGDVDLERRGAVCVARAAAACGVQRIGYLSGASTRAENCWYPGTQAKFEAEAALRASGVPYTMFKATWFMEALDNFVRLLGDKKRALHIGKHPFAYHWIAAADYAEMVARAYALPEAANKDLFIYGPEALNMRQALGLYCRLAHPDAAFTYMPIWAAAIFARLGRRAELQAALPFFRYMETVGEGGGDPAEAWALLGVPQVTLEAWSEAKRAGKVQN